MPKSPSLPPLIHRFATLGSTNDTALALAAQGAPSFTTVVAGEQTAGRGRAGRPWASPPRTGLYFSVVFRPELPLARVPLFSPMAGLALAEAVDSLYAVSSGLKWPNDLLLGGRKVAGILCESDFSGTSPVVVVGIGVNVNTPAALLPSRPVYPASSFLAETGLELPLDSVLAAALDALRRRAADLERDPAPVLTAWNARSVLTGRAVSVRSGAAAPSVSGVCRGMDPATGDLLLDTPSGLRSFSAGEITLSPQ